MSENRRTKFPGVAIFVIVLIILGVTPWAIRAMFAPLQPPDLGTTATAYVTIASVHNTLQAQLELSSTSVMTTEVMPTDPPVEVTQAPQTAQSTADSANAPDPTQTPGPVAQRDTYLLDWVVATGEDSGMATEASTQQPTATIKLPKIYTATPPAPVQKHLELTDDQASQLIQKAITDLRDLKINFLHNALKITGTASVPGPLNSKIDVAIEIDGQLILDNQKLKMKVASVLANGKDVTATDQAQSAEYEINAWLFSFLVQRKVTSFSTEPNLLTIDALEYQTPDLPTPLVVETQQATQAATVYTITVIAKPITPTVLAELVTLTHTPQPTVQSGSGDPTATIQLPKMMSATPSEGSSNQPQPTNSDGSTTISSDQATLLTGGSLGPLTDANVSFSPDGITITGRVGVPSAIDNVIPGIKPSQLSEPVEVKGQPEIVDGKPHFALTSLTVGSANFAGTSIGDAIESAINNWLIDKLIPGNSSSLSTDDNGLTAKP